MWVQPQSADLWRRVQKQGKEKQIQKEEGEKMAVRGQQSKRRPVLLIKRFAEFEDKVIYQGTLRKAERLIPPSKVDQYKIVFMDEEGA